MQIKKPRGSIKLIFIIITALILVFFGFVYGIKFQKEEKRFENKSSKPIAKEINPNMIKNFELFIPKLNIDVPVIPNVNGTNEKVYSEALKGGVAHYAGTALPDGGSNIFIFGHSSSILGTGKYDKVFASLGDLAIGDEIILLFNDMNYKYSVIDKKIVPSGDSSVLSSTNDEQLTLMTCWPIGTDAKRLVIIAKRS